MEYITIDNVDESQIQFFIIDLYDLSVNINEFVNRISRQIIVLNLVKPKKIFIIQIAEDGIIKKLFYFYLFSFEILFSVWNLKIEKLLILYMIIKKI